MSDQTKFLVAQEDYIPEQIILKLGSTKTSKDNASRIQISEKEYILPPVQIYHACEPNAYINWDQMTLKAQRTILKNDRITYHYGTSEYDYGVGAFKCDCGSKLCVGYFSGFRDMTHDEQARLINHASEYIANKMR
jgi:hypothetical protein